MGKRRKAFVQAKKLEAAFIRAHRIDAASEQKGFCCYCHEPLTKRNMTAEHVVAKSNGGTNSKKNIKASCHDCNSTKSSLSEAKFLSQIKSPWGCDFPYLMIWSRRRINLAVGRSTKNLNRMFGFPD